MTSPLPWFYNPYDHEIYNAGYTVLKEVHDEEDGDLICRAVNAFDDMVSAIKNTITLLDMDAENRSEHAEGLTVYSPTVRIIIDNLSQLLQKIEEKETSEQ